MPKPPQKSKQSSKKDDNPVKLSDWVYNSLVKAQARFKSRAMAPKFDLDKNETLQNREKEEAAKIAQFYEMSGSMDMDFARELIFQVSNPFFRGRTDHVINSASVFIHGLNPQDELEAVLISQMAVVHNLSMEFMRRSIIDKQPEEFVESNTKRAMKIILM